MLNSEWSSCRAKIPLQWEYLYSKNCAYSSRKTPGAGGNWSHWGEYKYSLWVESWSDLQKTYIIDVVEPPVRHWELYTMISVKYTDNSWTNSRINDILGTWGLLQHLFADRRLLEHFLSSSTSLMTRKLHSHQHRMRYVHTFMPCCNVGVHRRYNERDHDCTEEHMNHRGRGVTDHGHGRNATESTRIQRVAVNSQHWGNPAGISTFIYTKTRCCKAPSQKKYH